MPNYDSNDEKTTIAHDDVGDLPNIDMSDLPIIENSSNSDLKKNLDRYFQEESPPFIELKTLLTENKKNLIDEFCKKMKKVETESNMRKALENIQSITDEYLKKGINLNLNYNGKTVTNLIFEKITYVLDDVIQVIHRNKDYDFYAEYKNEVFNSDGMDEKIISSIIQDLLLKGGRAERVFFITIDYHM